MPPPKAIVPGGCVVGAGLHKRPRSGDGGSKVGFSVTYRNPRLPALIREVQSGWRPDMRLIAGLLLTAASAFSQPVFPFTAVEVSEPEVGNLLPFRNEPGWIYRIG
jgi:hypothetical protein